MTLLGELALWVAVLLAAWGTLVSFAGARLQQAGLIASGQRAAYATAGFVGLACVGLASALLRSDFSIAYVALHTSANLPTPYKVSAFWAGRAGSLLFMSLALATCAAIAVWRNRRRIPEHAPDIAGTLSALTLVFLLATAFGANPYERLSLLPPDGRGMHPRLQSLMMAIHAPVLFIGCVAAVVPFAFASGALITRRLDPEWSGALRRWTLLAWLFLTLGMLSGLAWAHLEPDWRAEWVWHPVANTSVLPWLTATAVLHSAIIQEKRGVLRGWNLVLIAATFLLVVFGVFVHGGILSTAEPLARSTPVSWSAGFLLAGLVIGASLVRIRLGSGEVTERVAAPVSREGGLLFTSLLLATVAFSVLLLLLSPLMAKSPRGLAMAVGTPFLRRLTIALGLALVAFMGVGPLLAWRRASMGRLGRQVAGPVLTGVVAGIVLFALGMREGWALIAYGLSAFVMASIVQAVRSGMRARRVMDGEGRSTAFVRLIARRRRRYGVHVVHAGVVVLLAGFAGVAFRSELDVPLSPGESITAADPFGREWTFSSNGVSRFQQLNRHVTAVAVQTRRAGGQPRLVTSEKRQYIDSRGVSAFEPATEAGIVGTWREDVRIELLGASGNERATVRITFEPLVRWVWLGGVILMIGGLMVMWPQTERPGDGR